MHIIHTVIGTPKILENNINGDSHAVFTMEPLPAGYGTTIGNALRRALLSSLPGAAVTGVKIKGATHEFTTLPGVRDSIIDILLNLKQLRVKKQSLEPTMLTLKVNKEGNVYASDITPNSDVEILNSDLYITAIEPDTEFEMELRIEKGVGYKSMLELKKENTDASIILLDASFSPVLKVKYDVTRARVGQMTDLDKLELEIETDSSITATDALKFASNLLISYFTLFDKEGIFVKQDFMANVDEIMVKEQEEQEMAIEKSRETYTPIEILNLSPRTLNALINGGIGSIEQLTKCTESKLTNLRGFGRKAMTEVKDALKTRELKLFGED